MSAGTDRSDISAFAHRDGAGEAALFFLDPDAAAIERMRRGWTNDADIIRVEIPVADGGA